MLETAFSYLNARKPVAAELYVIGTEYIGIGISVAVEVLLATHPVRNHIRNDKLTNLVSEITLGKRLGMISLEDSLVRLVRQGLITVDDARVRSARPDELDSLLRG